VKCEVDHIGGEGPELDRDDALDQSPVGQLAIIVKSLAKKLEEPALSSEERADFRKMREEWSRKKWLWRRIGIYFVGIPSAAVAIWQLAKGIIEWIKNQ
jgi:hypothetical protein